MGIYCEINLFKPADGAFTPGSTIQGSIKYYLDEETIFNRITVTFKGKGHLYMRKKQRNSVTYKNHERYVNQCNTIHEDQKGQKALPIGSYEVEFSFKIPENIPSTLHCKKNIPRYFIKCNIGYFIKIEFKRPGLMKFNNKFKKEITIVSCIKPRLPNVPTICGELKSLTQLLARKKSVVNIKTTIENCVLKPGENLKFVLEVFNDTNVIIKGIETKLVEIYNFTSTGGRTVTTSEKVENTKSKTGSIRCSEEMTMFVEMNLPLHVNSLDYSKIVSKDYAVRITARLPLPHRDAVLNIPVQVGQVDVKTKYGDAPPSYWEAMCDASKSDEKNEERIL